MSSTLDFSTPELCECFGEVPFTRDSASMNSSNQRAEEMSQRFAEGDTLQLIASSYGITRERVRQIIGRLGKVTVADARAARGRAREEDRARLGQWVAEVLRDRPGMTIDELATHVGRTKADVNAVLDTESRRLLVSQHPSRRFWSDADLVAALQLAAEVGAGPMSRVKYDRIRGEFNGPSAVLILQRFGTWQAACAAAGVEMGRRRPGGYKRNWTDAEVLDYVVDYLATGSGHGTFSDFGRWVRAMPGAPSTQSVRNYLGPWSKVKRDALALLVAREQRELAALCDATILAMSFGRAA